MTRPTASLAILLAAAGTEFSVAGQATESKPAKVSKPFQYVGYTSPEFKGSRQFAEYVPMSDGVKLAVDVFVPTGGPERSAFPVILQYTPYQRSEIDPKKGPKRDLMNTLINSFFLSYGYALVYADMRGTGASTGWLMDFMPRICDDGRELIDWMAKQPWCDGNVGMVGGSYLGWSQTATASRGPKALKCIMPAVIPLEGYTGEVYPGGIYLQGFLKAWSGFMYFSQRNYYDPKSGKLPTTPVVDEDGDGQVADEIPLDVNGNGTFLDDGFPPKYEDGAKRQHIYYLATKDHEKNYDYASWAAKAFFIDAASPLGFTLYQLGPNAHVRGLMTSRIPIYHVGGWFDGFVRGSFELYCTMRQTNPSKILITPGYHNVTGGPFWKHLGENSMAFPRKLLLEHLRFLDRYLKGIRNGIDTEPPITIYVMHGGGWRFENEWPLKRQVPTHFYFNHDRTLTVAEPTEGADTYKADFTHSSSYGKNNGNRWLGIAGQTPSDLPIRTKKDKQCLAYTGAPMTQDTEVTGHPIVRFWVSSTADYGDFFVYLEDVDPDGRAVLVTEGQLRAGFAALYNNDEIIDSGAHKIDVLPDLPWHGFEKAEYVERILAGGKVIELVIDLHPTAWVFRKGHHVRVTIACADYPTFRLHPKLSPRNTPDDPQNRVPTITVHRSASQPSHVELPVIPESSPLPR